MPSPSSNETRLIVGCMTGTSLDGLDAALVEVHGRGLSLHAKLLGLESTSFDQTLRADLHHLAQSVGAVPIDYLRAARALGRLHAKTIAQLLNQHHAVNKIDFVVAHGQTIYHAPADPQQANTDEPFLSWQLFDPWPIVHDLKLPVCYDLRQADLIACGQGAPLTPITDWLMYRDTQQSRAVVNLGGIANITVLPASADVSQIRASDVCPCNLLIDGLVERYFPDRQFDHDGKLAAKGRLSDAIHAHIGPRPLHGRSTGREEFNQSWLQRMHDEVGATMTPVDAIAAAVEAVSKWVADAVTAAGLSDVILAGGGARNVFLVKRIQHHLAPTNTRVMLSDQLGVPCEAREAMAFALLGALSADGAPISLPQVTGARDPGVAGVWAWPS